MKKTTLCVLTTSIILGSLGGLLMSPVNTSTKADIVVIDVQAAEDKNQEVTQDSDVVAKSKLLAKPSEVEKATESKFLPQADSSSQDVVNSSNNLHGQENKTENSNNTKKINTAQQYNAGTEENSHIINNNKNSLGQYHVIVNNKNQKQTVKLLDIPVSEKYKAEIIKKAKELEKEVAFKGSATSILKTLPQKTDDPLFILHDLGMGNVPVLDQGRHGTCVTFTVTAILNAKMNAGDFISQQCFLELGKFMQDNFDDFSGWYGLWNSTALERIKKYGVISNDLCPHQYADTKQSLSYNEYESLSGKLWAHDFDYTELEGGDVKAVKKAIDSGHRIAIGMILHLDYIAGLPVNGKNTGLWDFASNDISTFVKEALDGHAGHALALVGYDDEKGLFKVRNSWGEDAGDSGEFYISYDYYKLLNLEAFEIK